MEEAYTIGIRLALEDGVSERIAAMGVEMARLERAAAVGLGDLERLRSGGGVTGARPAAEAARQIVTPSAAVLPMPEPLAASATASAERTPVQAAPRPHLAATTQPVRHPDQAAAAPVDRRSVIAPIVGPIAQRPVDVAGPAAAPTMRRLPNAPMEVQAVSPAARPTPAVAPRMAQLVPDMASLPRGVAPRAGERDPGDAASVAPPERSVPRESTDRAVGTPAPVMATLPPRARSGDGGQPRESVVARGDTRDRSAPAQGDIFLDGTRMGRWIVERMAREAGRPQAGSTAFDARMSPAWRATR